MTTSPAPQRQRRRSDRYKQDSGVSPSSDLMRRTAPEQTMQQLQFTQLPAAQPQPAQPRQPSAPRKRKPADTRMPRWLTVSIAVTAALLLVLVAASSLMNAYITTQQRAREAAYNKVLDNHPLEYRELIERYAAENNLHPAFVAAIIMNESSFRTKAESSVGARGLMQMMDDTAEWIAGKLDVTDYHFDHMYEAEANIRFGTWYLGYLARMFRGDAVLVAAAYHAGQGEVTGWLNKSSISPDGFTIPLENMIDGPTKIYAGRVTQAYAIYKALYYPDETTGGADVGADDGSAAASAFRRGL